MEQITSRRVRNIAFAAILVVTTPVQAFAAKVALIIGNSEYEHASPLANPKNDAQAIAAKLRTLGFETLEGYDLGAADMAKMAREFAREVRSADMALFFYAGHGIQVDGRNYLIPVDAVMDDELSIDFEAFSIDVITKQMEYTQGANLLILDACRDNPFQDKLARSLKGSTRSIGGAGLSEMNVQDNGSGTGIVFATEPGNVALDGDGQHSPFTEALLKHIGTPNEPITTIMSRVTGDVYRATDQQQRPWFNQSYTDEVVLHRVAAAPAAPVETATDAPAAAVSVVDLEEEKYMFELARESGFAEDYQAYLDFYPNGRYARFARIAIERLQGAEEQTAGLAPAQPEAPNVAAATRAISTYDPSLPLVLNVTQHVIVAPATQITEQALNMDRDKRREIQARLNATNNNVGTPDGAFGPNTRRGIAAWQTSNGLPATQYLNSLQLELLTSQTEATYAAYMVTQSTSSGGSRSSSSSRSKKSNGAVNSFVKGVGEGIGNAFGNKLFGN